MQAPHDATPSGDREPANSHQIGQVHAAETLALWLRQNAAPQPAPTAHPNRVRTLDAARARARRRRRADEPDDTKRDDAPVSLGPVSV